MQRSIYLLDTCVALYIFTAMNADIKYIPVINAETSSNLLIKNEHRRFIILSKPIECDHHQHQTTIDTTTQMKNLKLNETTE